MPDTENEELIARVEKLDGVLTWDEIHTIVAALASRPPVPVTPHPALEVLHPADKPWPELDPDKRLHVLQHTGCPTCRTDGPCQTRQLLLKGDSDEL